MELFKNNKNFYCINCNKKGHTNKNCNEPIISNGIIAFYIENLNNEQKNNINEKLGNYLNENLNITNIYFSKNDYKSYNKFKNYKLENVLKEPINKNIKFIMIQRRYSLGYIEYIRGKYNLKNLTSVIYLLEQMTNEEIQIIINNEYDFLWCSLWNDTLENAKNNDEYKYAKIKFNTIKQNNSNILNNTKCHFEFNEWGFPKGRRNINENDLECAKREFEEETKEPELSYNIIDCNKISENIIGTNEVSYIHYYYLAFLKSNVLLFNKNVDKINEIKDVKLLDINECLELIRPYHYNKINIIKNLYYAINDFLDI